MANVDFRKSKLVGEILSSVVYCFGYIVVSVTAPYFILLPAAKQLIVKI